MVDVNWNWYKWTDLDFKIDYLTGTDTIKLRQFDIIQVIRKIDF